MREISIALLLSQGGYSIQVCISGCPFCVWLPIFHSFFFMFFVVNGVLGELHYLQVLDSTLGSFAV